MSAKPGDEATLQFYRERLGASSADTGLPASEELPGQLTPGEPLASLNDCTEEVAARRLVGRIAEDCCLRREAVEQEARVRGVAPCGFPKRASRARQERVQAPTRITAAATGRLMAWPSSTVAARW